MHVGHLLQLESLNLGLLWGEAVHLSREISGVTATDLEDPARILQEGEIVLSGLVWWRPGDGRAKTDRFVSALRTAGATALLAGEETHGRVPDILIDSCREHSVPLFAVPARTTFRSITEAVHLRQWGDLSRRPAPHHALPENVRTELGRLVERGTGPAELLDRAFAHLGQLPCYLLTTSGRTVARTPAAPALPAHLAAEKAAGGTSGFTLRIQTPASPYDAWHLHLPDAAEAPPRVLHEIAEVIAQYRHNQDQDQNQDRDQTAGQQAADDLIALTDTKAYDTKAYDNRARDTHSRDTESTLRACGLPTEGPYRVVVAALGTDERGGAANALTEALRHLAAATSTPFAVGKRPGGEAIAVVHTHDTDDEHWSRLAELWPLLHACDPDTALHAGVSAPTATPDGLAAALRQARYALAAARTAAPRTARVTDVENLSTLASLMAGVPAEVREAYSTNALGPLTRHDGVSRAMLLETLEVFLAHDCSWTRTAEALHLHVNTVHYRIDRIEALTGRDLSRLDHKLDLYAALLCR